MLLPDVALEGLKDERSPEARQWHHPPIVGTFSVRSPWQGQRNFAEAPVFGAVFAPFQGTVLMSQVTIISGAEQRRCKRCSQATAIHGMS